MDMVMEIDGKIFCSGKALRMVGDFVKNRAMPALTAFLGVLL